MTDTRSCRKPTDDNIKMNAGTTWRRFVSESEPNYQDRENIRSLKSGNSWKVKRLSVFPRKVLQYTLSNVILAFGGQGESGGPYWGH